MMRSMRKIHSRAMTLIEVMVTIGIMVVVMGMAFTVYDQTLKASLKMTTRQAAMDYSILTMDQIVGMLGDAIAPTDLDDPAAVAASFGPGSLSVPVNKTGAGGGLYLLTLRRAKPERAEVPFEIEQTLIKARGDSGALIKSTLALGGRVKDFQIEMSFRYALESRPGEPVRYVDRLEPGQWPALIQVTLSATMDDYPKEPVALTTSVIPGRIPKTGGAK